MGWAGIYPECGGLLVNCIVADGACSDCGCAEEVYTGTIYG